MFVPAHTFRESKHIYTCEWIHKFGVVQCKNPNAIIIFRKADRSTGELLKLFLYFLLFKTMGEVIERHTSSLQQPSVSKWMETLP